MVRWWPSARRKASARDNAEGCGCMGRPNIRDVSRKVAEPEPTPIMTGGTWRLKSRQNPAPPAHQLDRLPLTLRQVRESITGL